MNTGNSADMDHQIAVQLQDNLAEKPIMTSVLWCSAQEVSARAEVLSALKQKAQFKSGSLELTARIYTRYGEQCGAV